MCGTITKKLSKIFFHVVSFVTCDCTCFTYCIWVIFSKARKAIIITEFLKKTFLIKKNIFLTFFQHSLLLLMKTSISDFLCILHSWLIVLVGIFQIILLNSILRKNEEIFFGRSFHHCSVFWKPNNLWLERVQSLRVSFVLYKNKKIEKFFWVFHSLNCDLLISFLSMPIISFQIRDNFFFLMNLVWS